MATKYVDQTATGLNNGTSAANAWQSIWDMSKTGIAAGDTIEFVAGSGTYREVFNSDALTVPNKGAAKPTTISFDAATKEIRDSALGLAGFTVGGQIRITGSASNDRQFTVASSAADKIVVHSTNVITDEAAGAAVRVVQVSGTTSKALEQCTSGTVSAPITFILKTGTEISAGVAFDATQHRWNASATAGFWYLTMLDGSNPSLVSLATNSSAAFNNVYFTNSAETIEHQLGGTGAGRDPGLALVADGVLGWGDLDTLGYSTLYVRWDAGNPAAIQCEWGQAYQVVASNYPYHRFLGGATYGLMSFGYTTVDCYASASTWVASRIVTRWAAYQSFALHPGAATGKFILDHCISFWGGHRGFVQDADSEMSVYNCISYGDHLFSMQNSALTSAATMNVYNSIGVNEAGAIDKAGANSILNEDYNSWNAHEQDGSYVLGYIHSANWPTTGANSYPPSYTTAGGKTQAQLEAVGAVDPHFAAISDLIELCDFSLTQDSVLFRKGASGKGFFYQGIDETTPHSAVNPNIGAYATRQTTIKTARTARA